MISRLLLVTILVMTVCSIPFKAQIALLNSLQVGRDEDPMVWGCNGCDQTTRPIRSHVIEQNSKDIKAILSVYDEFTVLSFRYTATFKNIIEDILFAFQTQDEHAPSGCKVQKEYDNMWNLIRNDTYDDLHRSSCTGHLIITGISLGGGLASISYVDIKATGIFKDIQIITFGSPRVGNQAWANWFNQQLLSERYYIKNDPIAVLPFCLTKLICNYKQVGIPIQCNKNKEECKSKPIEYEEKIDPVEAYEDFMKMVEENGLEDEDVGSLIDHIYGYPKIKDYTLVEPI